MSTPSNPPAFARPAGWNGLGHHEEHYANDDQAGMSLRDYFAAKAMHAELNTAGAQEAARDALVAAADEAGQTIEQRIASNAYRLADAMLDEREKR